MARDTARLARPWRPALDAPPQRRHLPRGRAGRLTGIFTDADLRRLLENGRTDALGRPIREVMTRKPKFVRAGDTAADAIEIINRYFIEELPVVDRRGRLVGLVDVQDLLAAGVGL